MIPPWLLVSLIMTVKSLAWPVSVEVHDYSRAGYGTISVVPIHLFVDRDSRQVMILQYAPPAPHHFVAWPEITSPVNLYGARESWVYTAERGTESPHAPR